MDEAWAARHESNTSSCWDGSGPVGYMDQFHNFNTITKGAWSGVSFFTIRFYIFNFWALAEVHALMSAPLVFAVSMLLAARRSASGAAVVFVIYAVHLTSNRD